MTARDDGPPCPAVFVTAREGARRCMVGEEMFRTWSKIGLIPRPAIDRGQIQRWHWPKVEAALAAGDETGQHAPGMAGALSVDFSREKRGRARAAPG